jgi:hypothetical protein
LTLVLVSAVQQSREADVSRRGSGRKLRTCSADGITQPIIVLCYTMYGALRNSFLDAVDAVFSEDLVLGNCK